MTNPTTNNVIVSTDSHEHNKQMRCKGDGIIGCILWLRLLSICKSKYIIENHVVHSMQLYLL